MNKLIIYIITLILSLASTFTEAQDNSSKWSLKDCIEYGYENNLQLLRNKNRITLSENNLRQIKNDRLPGLNSSASWNNSYGRNVDYVTNSYTNKNSSNINYGLSTSVNLFSGFRKKHEIEKSEIDLQADALDIETAKENLALNITSFYLDILYAQEQLQVAKDNLSIAEKQKERIQQLVDAGKKPNGDLLEQNSQIAKNESAIVDAENRLSLNYLSLYQALDIKSRETFLIQTPVVDIIENANTILINYSDKYESIISQRPSIRALNYRMKSAEKNIAIARSGYYPNLNLSASIGSGYSNQSFNFTKDPKNPLKLIQSTRKSFADQYEQNLSKSWGLSLSIPIFSKFKNQTAVKNATLKLEDMQLQQQEEHNRLYKQIQQAYTNALAAVKKYESQNKALEALEETFRYVEEKYQLGMLSNFDYNEALNNLTVAKSNMLQAKYEYIFRTKILEFYNGTPLQL